MRIFISADIEGISGIATIQQLLTQTEYDRFRRMMTEEVNAAIHGAFNGGAKEVVVADGHGNMSNILLEKLDSRARLISGNNRVMSQLEGLDDTFDAIIFIGHHGREGASNAVISHTYAGICIDKIKVNGKELGETEINSIVAGTGFNVPTIFISGDDVYVEEVKETLPNIASVVTKYARNRLAAEMIHPDVVHKLIEKEVAKAVRNVHKYTPLVVEAPYTFEMQFKGPQQAQMTSTIPTIKMLSPTRIMFTCEDIVTAYKLMWACIIIGAAATNGVNGDANAY